jgi:hypothetical protein
MIRSAMLQDDLKLCDLIRRFKVASMPQRQCNGKGTPNLVKLELALLQQAALKHST